MTKKRKSEVVPRSGTGADAVRSFWCVLKAHTWASLIIPGIPPMVAPLNGPQRWIPVFDTREQAVAWSGSEEHIAEARSVATPLTIRINKCTSPAAWYAGRIGETMTVERVEINRHKSQGIPEDVYWCREGGTYNCLNYVRRSDASEINL